MKTMALREKIMCSEALVSSGQKPLNSSCALTKPTCKICQSKGYVYTTAGAYISAEVCRCVSACNLCMGAARLSDASGVRPCKEPSPTRVVQAVQAAKIPSLYLDADIEQFRNYTGNGRDILGTVRKVLKNFKVEGGPGLIISGPVGVGKTYLLAAIAKHFLSAGEQVKFIDFHRLLSVIRAAYADKKSEEEILGPLIDADILIIDELGKGRNNDWEQEKLDQVVMGRYNQNKVIIASTNYLVRESTQSNNHLFNISLDNAEAFSKNQFNPDVFENLEARIGKRIYSRLLEKSYMLELTGDDFRRSHRKVDRGLEQTL
jgi:DNA replication protein DnaC